MKLETKFNIGDEVYEVYREFIGSVSFSRKMTVIGIAAEVVMRGKKTICRNTYDCEGENETGRSVIEENLCTDDQIGKIKEGALNDEIKYYKEQIKEAEKRKEELLNGK